MDIYKECFDNLTPEQEWCARMCESVIAYKGDIDNHYLNKYRVSLGNDMVTLIFNTLKKYIDTNYTIAVGVHTDTDGCTYNSLVRK